MSGFNLFSKTHTFSIPTTELNLAAGLQTEAKGISIQQISSHQFNGTIKNGVPNGGNNMRIYSSIHLKEEGEQTIVTITSSVSLFQKLSLVLGIIGLFYLTIHQAVVGNWPWGIVWLAPLFSSIFTVAAWGLFSMHLEESFQKYKKMLTAPSPS